MAETAVPLPGAPAAPPVRLEGDLIEVLATRVEALVERQRAAQVEVERLRAQLDERERRIRELERGAEAARRMRSEVGQRLDGLIANVERLQRARA